MPQFIKQYNTPSGLVEIKITYQPGVSAELDFDVVEDIELGYGYEDEDQLTFYPNTCKLVFDDFKKTNYDILKLSLGAYQNTLPQNKMTYGGVEIKLGGAIKFKGYIDELTLNYDEEKLETSFEALDLTMQLRDMNVDRSKIIDTNGQTIPEGQGYRWTMPLSWYGVYKQLWPEFEWSVYDASLINTPGLYASFIKHDWIFYGDDVVAACDGQRHLTGHRYWSNPNDFMFGVFLNLDSTGIYGQNRPCKTWTDYLKLLALQFGATIGVMDYGKVYFIKRFGHQEYNPLDISDKIIGSNFTKTVHLSSLRGVIIKNHWNGERTFEYGDVERTPNNEYKYEGKVKIIDTYIGSYRDEGSSGTSIFALSDFYTPCNSNYILGCWSVIDPQINSEGQIYQILGKWQKENRKVPKDLIECKLDGIDYDMITIYKITPHNLSIGAILFRAMTIKKSFIKNETKLTGIEI